jgi:hypothetical protein
MTSRIYLFAFLSCIYVMPVHGQDLDVSLIQTRAELSDYRETTRYNEVMGFLEAVVLASEELHLTSFGYTTEGRSLPLLVYGDVWDASSEEAIQTGKTRVFIQANIHAGEVCGKEALLILIRKLADGEHAQWADSLVVLIAPVYNTDGNERISLYNRPRQHGPIGGMGQRPNAQGLDLNRDHMKLDSPEARSLVKLIHEYNPHVLIDLHTTNGTIHGYHLTYSPPLNPNTAEPIIDLLRNQWLPEVRKRIKTTYDWDFYYYGNVPRPGGSRERGWYTFDHRPRFNNNYVGLRNRIAILSEAYSYATFEDRIKATLYFVEENLNYAYEHASAIQQLIEEVDLQTIVGQTLAVRSTHKRSPEPIPVLMGEVVEERNPYTGEVMLRREDTRTPEQMYEFGTFQPTESETAPKTYFIPPTMTTVIERINAHGIWVEALSEPRELVLETFRIDSTHVADRPFQGRQERTLFGAYETITTILPAGTMIVPVDQSLGRLVFYLLEPRSDDGLVNWALMDDVLDGVQYYPILREPAQ